MGQFKKELDHSHCKEDFLVSESYFDFIFAHNTNLCSYCARSDQRGPAEEFHRRGAGLVYLRVVFAVDNTYHKFRNDTEFD